MATDLKKRTKPARAKTPAGTPTETPAGGAVNLEEKLFRLLGMVLFGFIMYFLFFGFVILAGVQYLLYFVDDAPHAELKSFTDRLRTYISEIFAYIGLASDRLPFPFSPFPKK